MTQRTLDTFRYTLTFAVAGLPKTPNQLLGAHWTIRSGHAKKWLKAVRRAIELNGQLPAKPLKRAKVHCIRHSSGKLDRTGLSGSFKAVIDALVKLRVIEDDTTDHIDDTYAHEIAPPKQGRITVTVVEAP